MRLLILTAVVIWFSGINIAQATAPHNSVCAALMDSYLELTERTQRFKQAYPYIFHAIASNVLFGEGADERNGGHYRKSWPLRTDLWIDYVGTDQSKDEGEIHYFQITTFLEDPEGKLPAKQVRTVYSLAYPSYSGKIRESLGLSVDALPKSDAFWQRSVGTKADGQRMR